MKLSNIPREIVESEEVELIKKIELKRCIINEIVPNMKIVDDKIITKILDPFFPFNKLIPR